MGPVGGSAAAAPPREQISRVPPQVAAVPAGPGHRVPAGASQPGFRPPPRLGSSPASRTASLSPPGSQEFLRRSFLLCDRVSQGSGNSRDRLESPDWNPHLPPSQTPGAVPGRPAAAPGPRVTRIPLRRPRPGTAAERPCTWPPCPMEQSGAAQAAPAPGGYRYTRGTPGPHCAPGPHVRQVRACPTPPRRRGADATTSSATGVSLAPTLTSSSLWGKTIFPRNTCTR